MNEEQAGIFVTPLMKKGVGYNDKAIHSFITLDTDDVYVVMSRGVLFAGSLLGLSPVLKTLTQSYSSDTIWALTITLSAIHLIFHDYQFIINAKTLKPSEYVRWWIWQYSNVFTRNNHVYGCLVA